MFKKSIKLLYLFLDYRIKIPADIGRVVADIELAVLVELEVVDKPVVGLAKLFTLIKF